MGDNDHEPRQLVESGKFEVWSLKQESGRWAFEVAGSGRQTSDMNVDFCKMDVGPVLYQEIGFTISWHNGSN
jgi:hypothetical protein